MVKRLLFSGVYVSFSVLQTSCFTLNKYLMGPLGRYLLNVSTAAEQCSQMLCKSHGRCLRKVPDSDVYLHLSPSTHRITSQSGKLKVTGMPGQAELAVFRTHFQCQCYSGYRGDACEQKERGQNRASSVLGTWPLCLLLPLGLLSLLHWGNWEAQTIHFFCRHWKGKFRLVDIKVVSSCATVVVMHFQQQIVRPGIRESPLWQEVVDYFYPVVSKIGANPERFLIQDEEVLNPTIFTVTVVRPSQVFFCIYF